MQYLRWTHRNLNFPFGLPFWQLALAVLGLSIATAAASYFLFERPILRLKDRVGWWSGTRPAHAPSRRKPSPEMAGSSSS
jgi:peptidoglycan/LPS O-acetylase OafA/YrhL